MEEKLALGAGFRFHPTDEELKTYYLLRKVSDTNFTSVAVAVVDLNKSEPWDLPGKARTMGEKEWYFFSMKDRKYPTGLRTNRATQSGYWKTTGKDKEIFGAAAALIGMKKTLVFYKGRAPRGEKTNWVMHEYSLHNNSINHHPFKSSKEEWVVCRVFQKSSAPKKPQETISSSSPPPPPPSPQDSASIMVNEFGDAELLPKSSSSSSCGGFTNNNLAAAAGQSYSMANYWPSSSNEIIIPSSSSSTPSLPWPSGLVLLNPINSLLLKALQLRNFQQQIREATAANTIINHFATYNNNNNNIPHHQGFSHQLIGTDDDLNNNLSSVSAPRVLECLSQQQQEHPLNIAFDGADIHTSCM